jgi:signal transduction histidine kinase
MRRRAEELGGTCAIGPGAGGGTRVAFEVPASPSHAPAA